MDLRMTCGLPRGRVNVQSAEVATKLKGVCDVEIGKILLTESDNLFLCDKERKLVFAC